MDVIKGERTEVVKELWKKYDKDHHADEVVKEEEQYEKEMDQLMEKVVDVVDTDPTVEPGVVSQMQQIHDSYLLMYNECYDFNNNLRQLDLAAYKQKFSPYVKSCCNKLENCIETVRCKRTE
ncbi:hypothetical protein EHI_162670 [Entamoeba histolytica HM-1:IMSS]|uniref:Uncharacterized protein n=1 Tax=Entamoeba histolytica (strain ATCC 30459 / HM-1:IMSS / ABRM) TaxID=294381 RepID=B1N5Y3_ENTH1|nr:hypothetical protein EHI_162670 [Entamoeba histolytica HM-1:IMSS]EDS88625.1 hypothetical protein EHI_162670 [Entamoeba histolytica HM-1:IMSS]|eukprot:XP_001914599.1 hypothetical protein EHI_162670 [Entamoeba histolytica HM-1:IMSS]